MEFLGFKDDSDSWEYPSWFFSLARYNPGGPSWYGKSVRLKPALHLNGAIIGILAAAITCLLVLIVVLPIIRHRMASAITALNSIGTGVLICLCLLSPEWIHGHQRIISQLDYYHDQVNHMSLGIHVGLSAINVTLQGHESDLLVNETTFLLKYYDRFVADRSTIFYNEKIQMYLPKNMYGVMEESLAKGLPIPILMAFGCLTASTQGFGWSERLIESGYHTYVTIVFALVVWFLAQIFIAAVPRYGSFSYMGVGVILVSSSIVYFHWSKIFEALPCIVIHDKVIDLRYGCCFWMALGGGVWSFVYGFFLSTYDMLYPDSFLSVFDLNYDIKKTLSKAERLIIRRREEMDTEVSIYTI